MGKLIYLDNAATTKTSPTVVEAMLPYFTEYYGNASSIYSIGTKSKEAINKSRETIAATLGAKPEEIYFTAGGSESDNWALKATAEAYESKGRQRSSTMRSCIRANISRSAAMRFPILMSMRTAR